MSKKRFLLRAFSLLLCTLVLGLSSPRFSWATMVLPLDLKQLTDQAGRIFVGRCDDITQELDENGIPSTYAHLTVTSGIKGVSDGQTILIKQFGVVRGPLNVGEGESAIVPMKTMSLAGGAYEPGKEYLLFLYPESKLGFTSPVGGGQGRFELTAAEAGNAALTVATNPLDNRYLQTFKEGPVPLGDLVKKVKDMMK